MVFWIELGFIFFLFIGSIILFGISLDFPGSMGRIPGPALFPQIVLSLLFLLCLVTLVRNRAKIKYLLQLHIEFSSKTFSNILSTVAVITVYSILVSYGYFLYATLGFLFLFALILQKIRQNKVDYLSSIIFSLSSTIILYVLFVKILRIPI